MISMIDDDCVDVDYDMDNYNMYSGSMGIGFAEVSDDRRHRTGSIILSSNLPFVEGNLELDGAWAVQPFSSMGIGFEDVDMTAYQAVALSLEAAKTGSSSKGKGKEGKKKTMTKASAADSTTQRSSPYTVSVSKTAAKKEQHHHNVTSSSSQSTALHLVQHEQEDQSMKYTTLSDTTCMTSSMTASEAQLASLIYGQQLKGGGGGYSVYSDDGGMSDLKSHLGQEGYQYEARIDISSLSGGVKQSGYIGAYSPEARKLRIQRFNEKRHRRVWTKKVKYDVRKNFADSRLRVKGRFVKKEDEELMRELKDLNEDDDLLEMVDASDDPTNVTITLDVNPSTSHEYDNEYSNDYGNYY